MKGKAKAAPYMLGGRGMVMDRAACGLIECNIQCHAVPSVLRQPQQW